jgi:hypothetical protein
MHVTEMQDYGHYETAFPACYLLRCWLLEIDIGDRRRQFNCVRMCDRGRGPITRAVPSRQHGVEAKATYLSDQ